MLQIDCSNLPKEDVHITLSNVSSSIKVCILYPPKQVCFPKFCILQNRLVSPNLGLKLLDSLINIHCVCLQNLKQKTTDGLSQLPQPEREKPLKQIACVSIINPPSLEVTMLR